MKKLLLPMSILGSVMVFAQLSAGIVAVSEQQYGQNSSDQTTHTLYIDKTRVREDVKGSSRDLSIIYIKETSRLYLIDHQENTLTEFTPDDVKRIKAARARSIEGLKKSLSTMPTVGKKNMDKVMKQVRSLAENSALSGTFTASGSEPINGWSASHYMSQPSGGLRHDLWTVDLASLGMTQEQVGLLKNLSDALALPAAYGAWYTLAADSQSSLGYTGIPVKRTRTQAGQMVFREEVKQVREQALEESLFVVPSNLKKVEFK